MQIFKKIRLGASVAALFLFFLPWLDIQCSQKSMVTQTGFQIIYGGATLSDELRSLKEMGESDSFRAKKSPFSIKERKRESRDPSEESLGYSPLIAIAFLLVVISLMASVVSIFRPLSNAEPIASVLPAIVLLLILAQFGMGFPVELKMQEELKKSMSTAQQSSDPGKSLGSSMAAFSMMSFSVLKTSAFYLQLAALGIPSLLLINRLLDRVAKKDEPHST